MFMLWKGRTQESRLQIQDTHADEVQKSLSKQFGAWLIKTLSRMIIVIILRNTKEVQNIVMNQNWKSHHEHRDGSKILEEKSSRTSRRIKNSGKVVANIETDEKFWKKSSRTSRRIKNAGKVVPKIAMDEQDSGRGQTSRHQRIRAERVGGSKIGTKNTQRIRDELADGSKIGANS